MESSFVSLVTDTRKNEKGSSNHYAEQLYYAGQHHDIQQNDNILSKSEERNKNFNTEESIADVSSFTATNRTATNNNNNKEDLGLNLLFNLDADTINTEFERTEHTSMQEKNEQGSLEGRLIADDYMTIQQRMEEYKADIHRLNEQIDKLENAFFEHVDEFLRQYY